MQRKNRSTVLSNIQASQTVATILKSTVGPDSMLKMLIDPMGGLVLTNDGHIVLREIDVNHPAAKSVIEVSRAQDEERGDGTTTTILLLAAMLSASQQLLESNIHPSIIVASHMKALDIALKELDKSAVLVDLNDSESIDQVVKSALSTKLDFGISEISALAKKAILILSANEKTVSQSEVKVYIKIEKIPGGSISDAEVLNGIMVEKDIVHPQMERKIRNPKVVILDCPLEYKKGESQTRIEISAEEQWNKLLREEEEEIKEMCQKLKQSGCNLIVSEKGISDLAQHFLMRSGISAIRRVKKTEADRIARASGATIVSRVEELNEGDIGNKLNVFYVEKIGDNYYSYFINQNDPRACSIILRGGSKDVLNKLERCLHDALCTYRNFLYDPKIVPGGGAIEMRLSCKLESLCKTTKDVYLQSSLQCLSEALEILPRSLAANSGGRVVNLISELRNAHSGSELSAIGITEAQVTDCSHIKDLAIVKGSSIRVAVESACCLLRVDDILAGKQKSS